MLDERKMSVRNGIISYLELASSPDAQRAYERRVSIARVPDELILMWEELGLATDSDWYGEPEFSLAEQAAIRDFHQVWNAVSDEAPDPMPPTIDALIGTAVWQRLIDGARKALLVFAKRGRLDEAASS
ncbi:hypothetical protein [Ancylobacter sp.]|uniref:hypothetical protein n=1 Tax=Ancylobacter sp. TaxID=1872567 RepID=UPI003BAC9C70